MHSEMMIRDIATERTCMKLRVVCFVAVLAFTDNAGLDDATPADLTGVVPGGENETGGEEAG